MFVLELSALSVLSAIAGGALKHNLKLFIGSL